MESFNFARHIRIETKTIETPGGADLYLQLGNLMRHRGNYHGAMGRYAEAQRIREQTDTMNTPQGTILLAHIGMVEHDLGDLQ